MPPHCADYLCPVFSFIYVDMNNPIISVIVPVYNIKPKFLRQCFDSIVGQTLADFELIIVNDASTTHCFDVCKEYADKDERIVLIDKKQNEGVD